MPLSGPFSKFKMNDALNFLKRQFLAIGLHGFDVVCIEGIIFVLNDFDLLGAFKNRIHVLENLGNIIGVQLFSAGGNGVQTFAVGHILLVVHRLHISIKLRDEGVVYLLKGDTVRLTSPALHESNELPADLAVLIHAGQPAGGAALLNLLLGEHQERL